MYSCDDCPVPFCVELKALVFVACGVAVLVNGGEKPTGIIRWAGSNVDRYLIGFHRFPVFCFCFGVSLTASVPCIDYLITCR